MDEINVAAAARRLGISEPAARKMITAGRLPNRAHTGPALVASADVDRVMRERRAEALRRHPDTEGFARQVRELLWPSERIDYVRLMDGRREVADANQARHLSAQPHGRAVLRTLTPDAAAIFGWAAVDVAATPARAFTDMCRFCYADTTARVHGGLRPTDSPAYRVLLGCSPCPADRQRWATEAESGRRAMAALRQTDEFRAAQAGAEQAREAASVAVSRLRTAARVYAAVDPSSARLAGVQRAGVTASGGLPCGCTRDVYCDAHAAAFGTHDRRAARQ
ncbi:hypothetical protein [Streptomyces viridochromogenes]|nr:hypothetical protein [Streptomyces viridochromogenes]